jgi:hypothetical protein
MTDEETEQSEERSLELSDQALSLDPDQNYQKLTVLGPTKEYISRKADEDDTTIIRKIADIMPMPSEADAVGDSEREMVKITPELDTLISQMTGASSTKGRTLAFFTLKHAIEEGDVELDKLLEDAPELPMEGYDE